MMALAVSAHGYILSQCVTKHARRAAAGVPDIQSFYLGLDEATDDQRRPATVSRHDLPPPPLLQRRTPATSGGSPRHRRPPPLFRVEKGEFFAVIGRTGRARRPPQRLNGV